MRIGMAIIRETGHVIERSNMMMIMESKTRGKCRNPDEAR
jgi:hypothetical protein